ncbi:MAG: hypothetical protein PH343_07030, partial [Nitrospira sp.]|nr:hypothetical protein [Nitrospira sp.]
TELSKPKVIRDVMENEIRTIEMESEYAKIRMNIWRGGNMVVIFKTFKMTNNTHQMQFTCDEFEAFKELKI